MRLVLVALLAGLGSSCVTRPVAGPDAEAAPGMSGRVTARAVSPSRASVRSRPEVTPDRALFGTVVLVNPLLRFVVMDFPVRKMPALDQRLNVYHSGQKTGEVRVTGPTRDTTVAGDITTGEAQVGDEVRED